MSNLNGPSGLKGLLFGSSILALGVAVTPTFALAQATPQSTSSSSSTDTAPASSDGSKVKEVVVTGVRQSLKTSQQIKRSADTVVDSITATDIGAFPDKSVAEALQRVAGITVNRFAASDDTSHFSAEPSGVIVRGLQQVRSEFNGRDSFSANSSRGLDWGDISPELMAGVDSYKNQTAELIEGGIAGSINMRTRVPFDSPGQLMALTADANWGDLSQKVTPDVSAIYSNRWQTPIGEFGFMVDGAMSKVQTISQGIQYTRMGAYDDIYPGQPGVVWIPSQIDLRDTMYDRDRKGIASAGQWRSPDHKLLLTVQYNESSYSNIWHEHAVESAFADTLFGHPAHAYYTPNPPAGDSNAYPSVSGGNPVYPAPYPGTPDFTFDSNGLFQSGALTDPVGWWGTDNTIANAAGFGMNSSGQPMVNACYSWNGCSGYRAPDFYTATRYNQNREFTADSSINLKWDPTERLHFNFDVQQVHSAVKNYDIEVDQASWEDIALNAAGNLPKITLSPPLGVNPDPGVLSNASNYYYRAVMDHMENSGGDEWAARADMRWDIKNGWLDSLKVGFRHADREQTVRWSAYNWANIANEWTGCNQYVYFNITNGPGSAPACSGGNFTAPAVNFAGYPANNSVMWNFPSNFMGGGITNINGFQFANYALIQNQATLAKALGAPSLGAGAWDPLCSNTGSRSGEVPGKCFTPAEIDQISEVTDAFYFMLKFGGPELKAGRFPLSGNIGLRDVITNDKSAGGLGYAPQYSAQQTACPPPPVGGYPVPKDGQGNPLPPGSYAPKPIGCYLSAQDIAFANGGSVTDKVGAVHHNLLPSFNVKMDLNDQWLVRLAISRAMSRPDIGLLKNYLQVGAGALPSTTNLADPKWVKDSSGNITGVTPYYTAQAYNPYLKPTTADQFDISIEHYFASVGSLTLDLFYKQFHNYIQYGAFDLNVTNNGVTRTVQVTGPTNRDGGRVKGLELAYQRFFTFLPSPLDGFGVQSNFTYVDQQGVDNTHLHIVNQPSTTNSGVPDYIQVNALEGLSKYSFNVIGMYEKGPLSARLAYNWRDKFLVTALDCCVYLPVWQMPQGMLDGSLRYRVTDHLEIDLQGSNLLNTMTVLKQQVTDSNKGGLLLPNAWFQNDRRIQLGFRLKY